MISKCGCIAHIALSSNLYFGTMDITVLFYQKKISNKITDNSSKVVLHYIWHDLKNENSFLRQFWKQERNTLIEYYNILQTVKRLQFSLLLSFVDLKL